MTAPACIRCGGSEDLKDRGMAPGMTYCKPCRIQMAQPKGVQIDIEIGDIGISGSPEEVGLVHKDPKGKVFEDNTPTSAEQLLEFIKAECDNDKHTFIREWDLIDDPRITISVNVDGVRTYVDW